MVFLQVILIGHSAGGISVTQATYRFAKKIQLAVYLAATMLKLGYCTEQDAKDVKVSSTNFCLLLILIH